MKPPKCRLCSTPHWSNEPHSWGETQGKVVGAPPAPVKYAWEVTASNAASNTSNAASNNVVVASNNASTGGSDRRQGGPARQGVGGLPAGSGEAVSELPKSGLGPKQGWSREAYNAYQREYMRKRRAV
jgi:hypothetical protein